jgi:hypothetical protein
LHSNNQHVWFYQYVTTISDGRDLNRVFFLKQKKSLASRFVSTYILTEIMPLLTMQSIFAWRCLVQCDQISTFAPYQSRDKELADVFNAPFTFQKKKISLDLQKFQSKLNVKMLLLKVEKRSVNESVADAGGMAQNEPSLTCSIQSSL